MHHQKKLLINMRNYNFHRFLSLFECFGIYHGIMFDNDEEKNEHKVINQLIRDRKNNYTLAVPFEFNKCLEKHFNISLPGRNDQNPIQIRKAVEGNTVTMEQLTKLRKEFCKSLAIVDLQ